MNTKLRLHTSSFLLLTSAALLSACANRPAISPYPYSGDGFAPPAAYGAATTGGAPADYSSSLHQSHVVSRQNVPISDEQAASQRAGTTRTRQADSSETVTKRGKIKKQTSTTEEIIKPDPSKVIPTSDEDAR
jgi:hypothetical protein